MGRAVQLISVSERFSIPTLLGCLSSRTKACSRSSNRRVTSQCQKRCTTSAARDSGSANAVATWFLTVDVMCGSRDAANSLLSGKAATWCFAVDDAWMSGSRPVANSLSSDILGRVGKARSSTDLL